MTRQPRALAILYSGLAEALAPSNSEALPGWMASPGKEWPLYEAVVQLTSQQPTKALAEAVAAISGVLPASVSVRQREYASLFIGNKSPPIWLYESQHIYGHMPGPSTFSVEALYTQAGLEIVGAELADHAAFELAFLANLAEMETASPRQGEEWAAIQNMFIKKHAGRWLPAVGQKLFRASCPAWAAIGSLLIALFQDDQVKYQSQDKLGLPALRDIDSCNLCGFCVQVCPTEALCIIEDHHFTSLILNANLCVHCWKCQRVCEEKAIIRDNKPFVKDFILLRKSPRVICPTCGDATVSQAEFDLVSSQLGSPEWLVYCLECRKYMVEMPL